MAAYAGREHFPGRQVGAREHVADNARGFFHPVGTCAIGAVVDGDGRVRGCEGLSVADASIMPSIPRANTNLSTIATRLTGPAEPGHRRGAHANLAAVTPAT